MRGFLLIFIFLMLTISNAMAIQLKKTSKIKNTKNTNSRKNKYSKKSRLKKRLINKKVRLKTQLSTFYYSGFSDEVEPSQVYKAQFEIKVTPSYQFFITQEMTHYYEIDKGDAPIQAADTVLSHSYQFYKDFFSLNSHITLPLSKSSKVNEHYSHWSQSLDMNWSYFKNKLNFTYSPGYDYYFNKYNQTIDREPMKHYSFSHGLQLQIKWNRFFDLNIYGSHGINYAEGSDYEEETDQPLLNEDGFYSAEIWAQVHFTQSLKVALGYVQSNSEIVDTRKELYLYDANNSQWYLGIKYLF